MSDPVRGAGEVAETGSRGGFLRRLVRAALVAAGMLIAAAIGMYAILLLTVRGHDVIVPDLTRMTQAEAQAEAHRNRLEIEVAGTRIEPLVAEGRIFDQEPPPGSRTRPMRRVRVFLSAGQGSIEIPSFAGQPLRKAQLSLSQLGLRLGNLAYVPSLEQATDKVLAQSPRSGAWRQKGDAVDLLVSRGATERVYVMPSLEGLAVEQATTLLADVGVRVGLSRRPGPEGGAAGVVLEQKPAEGFPLRERETVRLVVSQ